MDIRRSYTQKHSLIKKWNIYMMSSQELQYTERKDNEIQLCQVRLCLNKNLKKNVLAKKKHSTHPVETSLSSFVKNLRHKNDDDKLSAEEIVRLINLVNQPSHLKLINDIRALFGSHFFSLIQWVNQNELNNAKNYYSLYRLNTKGREFIGKLFSLIRLDYYSKKQECFDLFISIASAKNLDFNKTKACFSLLKTLDLPEIDILTLLKTHAEQMDMLAVILSKLNQYHVLNKQSVEPLKTMNHQNGLVNLHNAITSLENSNLLNFTNLTWVYTQSKNTLVIEIIKKLSSANILTQNIISSLPAAIQPPFNMSVIDYLGFAGLLESKTVDAVFKYFTHETMGTKKKLVEIINLFNKENFKISAEQYEKWLNVNHIESIYFLTKLGKLRILNTNYLEKVLNLDFADIKRLHHIILLLAKNHKLTKIALDESLNLIELSLDSTEPSTVIKYSRKVTNKPRSEFIIDNSLHFFVQHNASKKYNGGGCSIVKKAYETEDDEQPIFALKKLKNTDLNDGCIEAKREVNYQHLLGRNAFYFSRNHKNYIVMDWLNGKDLESYSLKELKKYPLENRLYWLYTGLSDLNLMHENYRLHGDIKPHNFILDTQNNKLLLIDFGAARKRDSNYSYYYTSQYLYKEIESYNYDFADDVYSMGFVIAKLFPEFCAIDESSNSYKVTFCNDAPDDPFEKAIMLLIKAMMDPNANNRCRVEHALNFCHQLLEQWDELTDEEVDELSKETIHCEQLTTKDVIYGMSR